MPARRSEDPWRFLKSARDDWLRSQGSRTLRLQGASAWAGDESLTDLRATIYRERGRYETKS